REPLPRHRAGAGDREGAVGLLPGQPALAVLLEVDRDALRPPRVDAVLADEPLGDLPVAPLERARRLQQVAPGLVVVTGRGAHRGRSHAPIDAVDHQCSADASGAADASSPDASGPAGPSAAAWAMRMKSSSSSASPRSVGATPARS